MEKRNRKEIEKNVKAIQEAALRAKTVKEVAELTGLTPQKVKTSLANHPIIRNRVMASLEANRNATTTKAPAAKATTTKAPAAKATATKATTAVDNTATMATTAVDTTAAEEDSKFVVICDAPSLTRALTSCAATEIVIPQFVYNTLVGLSKSMNYEERKSAEAVLMRIHTLHGWCTVAPKLLEGETLLVEPSEKVGWRAKALVSLACKYWAEGYIVTIKTRTTEIAQLAKAQGIFTVDFVSADDKASLKKIVG